MWRPARAKKGALLEVRGKARALHAGRSRPTGMRKVFKTNFKPRNLRNNREAETTLSRCRRRKHRPSLPNK